MVIEYLLVPGPLEWGWSGEERKRIYTISSAKVTGQEQFLKQSDCKTTKLTFHLASVILLSWLTSTWQNLKGILELVCLKQPKNLKIQVGSRCLKEVGSRNGGRLKAKPSQYPGALIPTGASWMCQLTEETDFK